MSYIVSFNGGKTMKKKQQDKPNPILQVIGVIGMVLGLLFSLCGLLILYTLVKILI